MLINLQYLAAEGFISMLRLAEACTGLQKHAQACTSMHRLAQAGILLGLGHVIHNLSAFC